MPALVICDLLGMPRTDMQRVKQWHEGLMVLLFGNNLDPNMVAAAHAYLALQRYVIAHVEQRVAAPERSI